MVHFHSSARGLPLAFDIVLGCIVACFKSTLALFSRKNEHFRSCPILGTCPSLFTLTTYFHDFPIPFGRIPTCVFQHCLVYFSALFFIIWACFFHVLDMFLASRGILWLRSFLSNMSGFVVQRPSISFAHFLVHFFTFWHGFFIEFSSRSCE